MQFERLRDLHKSSDDPARREKLLAFYTRIMTRAVGAERCSIFIHDPDKDRIWLKTGTGVRESEIVVAKEGSIVGKAIASGQTVHITGLETTDGAHKAVDQKTGFVTRGVLSVPIKSPNRDEVTGAFQLLNKKDGREFTTEDISLAEEIAENLHAEIDRIFVGQQIFNLTERLYALFDKLFTALSVAFGIAILLLLLSILWWGLSRLFAG
ncbi:MAG: GAF domain-containing protein [Pseudomonadota bacterium]